MKRDSTNYEEHYSKYCLIHFHLSQSFAVLIQLEIWLFRGFVRHASNDLKVKYVYNYYPVPYFDILKHGFSTIAENSAFV